MLNVICNVISSANEKEQGVEMWDVVKKKGTLFNNLFDDNRAVIIPFFMICMTNGDKNRHISFFLRLIDLSYLLQ